MSRSSILQKCIIVAVHHCLSNKTYDTNPKMRAGVIIALVCLVGLVAGQTDGPTTDPPVDCDVPIGEDGFAILLPNPQSCESYYVCDWGKPILMHCPKGLHFNPKLSVCDFPSRAHCELDNP